MDEIKRTARPRGADSARMVLVVETKAIAGRGVEGDPVRLVTQYWSPEGKLLAVNDPAVQLSEPPL